MPGPTPCGEHLAARDSLSGTFAESAIERQDDVWKSLDAHLDTFGRTRIVLIVADTSEEYEALEKAAG